MKNKKILLITPIIAAVFLSAYGLNYQSTIVNSIDEIKTRNKENRDIPISWNEYDLSAQDAEYGFTVAYTGNTYNYEGDYYIFTTIFPPTVAGGPIEFVSKGSLGGWGKEKWTDDVNDTVIITGNDQTELKDSTNSNRYQSRTTYYNTSGVITPTLYHTSANSDVSNSGIPISGHTTWPYQVNETFLEENYDVSYSDFGLDSNARAISMSISKDLIDEDLISHEKLATYQFLYAKGTKDNYNGKPLEMPHGSYSGGTIDSGNDTTNKALAHKLEIHFPYETAPRFTQPAMFSPELTYVDSKELTLKADLLDKGAVKEWYYFDKIEITISNDAQQVDYFDGYPQDVPAMEQEIIIDTETDPNNGKVYINGKDATDVVNANIASITGGKELFVDYINEKGETVKGLNNDIAELTFDYSSKEDNPLAEFWNKPDTNAITGEPMIQIWSDVIYNSTILTQYKPTLEGKEAGTFGGDNFRTTEMQHEFAVQPPGVSDFELTRDDFDYASDDDAGKTLLNTDLHFGLDLTTPWETILDPAYDTTDLQQVDLYEVEGETYNKDKGSHGTYVYDENDFNISNDPTVESDGKSKDLIDMQVTGLEADHSYDLALVASFGESKEAAITSLSTPMHIDTPKIGEVTINDFSIDDPIFNGPQAKVSGEYDISSVGLNDEDNKQSGVLTSGIDKVEITNGTDVVYSEDVTPELNGNVKGSFEFDAPYADTSSTYALNVYSHGAKVSSTGSLGALEPSLNIQMSEPNFSYIGVIDQPQVTTTIDFDIDNTTLEESNAVNNENLYSEISEIKINVPDTTIDEIILDSSSTEVQALNSGEGIANINVTPDGEITLEQGKEYHINVDITYTDKTYKVDEVKTKSFDSAFTTPVQSIDQASLIKNSSWSKTEWVDDLENGKKIATFNWIVDGTSNSEAAATNDLFKSTDITGVRLLDEDNNEIAVAADVGSMTDDLDSEDGIISGSFGDISFDANQQGLKYKLEISFINSIDPSKPVVTVETDLAEFDVPSYGIETMLPSEDVKVTSVTSGPSSMIVNYTFKNADLNSIYDPFTTKEAKVTGSNKIVVRDHNYDIATGEGDFTLTGFNPSGNSLFEQLVENNIKVTFETEDGQVFEISLYSLVTNPNNKDNNGDGIIDENDSVDIDGNKPTDQGGNEVDLPDSLIDNSGNTEITTDTDIGSLNPLFTDFVVDETTINNEDGSFEFTFTYDNEEYMSNIYDPSAGTGFYNDETLSNLALVDSEGNEIDVELIGDTSATREELVTVRAKAIGLEDGKNYDVSIKYSIYDSLIGADTNIQTDILAEVVMPKIEVPDTGMTPIEVIGVITISLLAISIIGLLILLILFFLLVLWRKEKEVEFGKGTVTFQVNKKHEAVAEKLNGATLQSDIGVLTYKLSEAENGKLLVTLSGLTSEEPISGLKFEFDNSAIETSNAKIESANEKAMAKYEKDLAEWETSKAKAVEAEKEFTDEKPTKPKLDKLAKTNKDAKIIGKVNVIDPQIAKDADAKETENTAEAKREKFSKQTKPELVKQSVAKGLEEPIAKKATKPELVEFLVTGKKPKLTATATVIG